jgi:hypothetical protein
VLEAKAAELQTNAVEQEIKAAEQRNSASQRAGFLRAKKATELWGPWVREYRALLPHDAKPADARRARRKVVKLMRAAGLKEFDARTALKWMPNPK